MKQAEAVLKRGEAEVKQGPQDDSHRPIASLSNPSAEAT